MSYKLNTMDVDKITPNPKDTEYDFEYERDEKLWGEMIASFKCNQKVRLKDETIW